MKTIIIFFFLFISVIYISCSKENETSSFFSSQQSSAVQAHFIGEHFGGGIIFYLDKTRTHGIIASFQDFEEPSSWSKKDTLTMAQSAGFGAGINNSNKIYKTLGNPQNEPDEYAAILCIKLSANGYNDWYLPSKNELNEMYLNKNIIGGFTIFAYWSSTEKDVSRAWFQNFGSGTQVTQSKLSSYSVRPVRYF